MSLLPYDRFVIETRRSLDEVIERLRDNVIVTEKYQPRRGVFARGKITKRFHGVLRGDGFMISKIIRYGSSFLPIIHGSFEPTPRGTAIHVRMKLHPLTVGFIFSFVAVVLWGIAKGFREGIPPVFAVLPCLFLPLLWLMAFFCFRYEAKRARALLERIFSED